MPTFAELKQEIEKGPLADELAPHWADVFTDKERVGRLKPDAAFTIHALLNDPTRSTKPGSLTVSRGEFLSKLAGLVPNLAAKDAATQARWTLLLNLATGGDAEVRVSRPEIQGLLDLAVSEGLLPQQTRNALKPAESVPCSRSEKLGWGSWSYRLVIDAKAVA